MAKFKLPPRTATLQFEGDYEGAEVVVRLDAPLNVADDLEDDDPRRNIRLIPRLVVSWNLEDDDGPIPVDYDAMIARVHPAFLGLIGVGFQRAMEEQAKRDFPPPDAAPSGSSSTISVVRSA